MEQKKNGGKREGAGRKPKADEIKIIEAMDAVAAPSDVWKKLYDRVNDGDVQAIKTWLSYRFGLPKQTVALEGGDESKPVRIISLGSGLKPDEVTG